MSSQYINLTNKSVSFSKTKARANFLSGITSLKDTISKALKVLKKVIDVINPFLAAFQNDPFVTVYKALVKTISDYLDSWLATGASIFVVTPFNQAGNREISIDINLLNPIDEAKQTVEAIRKTDSNYLVKARITELESLLSVPLSAEKEKEYKEELALQKTKVEEITYTKNYMFLPEFKLPKLSSKDAVEELILSFSNANDKYRPKWNSLNTVAGWGLILSATTQTELLNNLNKLNKIFNFTELSRDYERFKSGLDSWSRTMKKKGVDSKEKVAENKLIEDMNSLKPLAKDAKSTLIQEGLDSYFETVFGSPITSAISSSSDSYPKWIPFTLEIVPYLRDFKNIIIDSLNVMMVGMEAMDTVAKSILVAFTQKIDSLIKMIESVNEMLTILESLKFGLSGTAFSINDPQMVDTVNEGGGVDFMKSQLTILKDFPDDLIDLSNKTDTQRQYLMDEMERVRQSDFSILVFIGMGFTSKNKVAEQFKKLSTMLSLFNLSVGEDNSDDSTVVDGIEEELNQVHFEIYPDNLTSYDSLVTTETLPLTIIFNQNCSIFSYSIACMGYSQFEDKALSDLPIMNSNVTLSIKNLVDLQKYELTISAYGNEEVPSLTRSFRFSTNFFMHDIDADSDGNLVENNTVTTYEGDLITPDGMLVPFMSTPNTSLELAAISGEGQYGVSIFSDSSRKQFVSKKFKNCETFIQFKKSAISEDILYVRDFPYNLHIPDTYGEYALVVFKERMEILKLSSCIHIDEETIYISFFNNGAWDTPMKVISRLSTNLSDFCLTLA